MKVLTARSCLYSTSRASSTDRVGVLALMRRDILWRGTYYPTSTVRAGLRLRL